MQKTITTYAELEQYCRAFADGHFEVFILIGDPGLEKTTMLRKALEGRDARWIEGTLSAFQLYCEAWEYRNHIFAIDDVDNLYGDRNAVRLLKCLCQTELTKRLGWHTNAAKLDKEGIPREFDTRSPVAIIANEWKALNKNIGALEDRGILIHFRPSAKEVHERVRAWFDDDEIYQFIGEHLHLIAAPSMRHYVNCQRLKKAGLDWREALYESIGITEEMLVVARLLDDPCFASGEARVAEFIKQTGRSRATYFRIAQKLRDCDQKGESRSNTEAGTPLRIPSPDREDERAVQTEVNEAAPDRVIESIAEATNANPTRIYVQKGAGAKVHSFKASKLPAFRKVVKLLLRVIDLGYPVIYRGEILTAARFLEVIETAHEDAKRTNSVETDSQDAA